MPSCGECNYSMQQSSEEKFEDLQYWLHVKNVRLGSYVAYMKLL